MDLKCNAEQKHRENREETNAEQGVLRLRKIVGIMLKQAFLTTGVKQQEALLALSNLNLCDSEYFSVIINSSEMNNTALLFS